MKSIKYQTTGPLLFYGALCRNKKYLDSALQKRNFDKRYFQRLFQYFAFLKLREYPEETTFYQDGARSPFSGYVPQYLDIKIL